MSQVVGVVIVRTIVILGIVALFQEFHRYGTAVSVWRCLHWHTIASYDVDVTTWNVLVVVLVACLVVLIRDVLRVLLKVADGVLGVQRIVQFKLGEVTLVCLVQTLFYHLC